jgi:carboxymethylenebutenolidase
MISDKCQMDASDYLWVMVDIDYPSADGPLPGYLAIPPGEGPWPAVVVVQDAMGLTADLKRITDRFAAHGYLAMAPALYRRGARIRCVVSTLRSVAAGTGPAIDAIVAARDHLAADSRCTGKVGSVGFCMGGGFCLQLAPRGVFDAAAPNYGMVHRSQPDLTRSCPMVASYGARDVMLRGAAQRVEAELAEGNVPRDVKEYPNVGHSFMNDWGTRQPLQLVERIAGLAYSQPEAEDAWARILAFFDEHLRA